MTSICFYFQVHQPYRTRNYRIFDIGEHSSYFDEEKNKEIMKRMAHECYLPMNTILLEHISKHKEKFKVAFSISGVALEQMELYAPEVIKSFQELAQSGCVEFLSETYYHSLSFLYSKEEFKEQILKHKQAIKKYFNQEPTVFRNTELVYTNELASFIEGLGYEGIFAQGSDSILGWNSPNYLYGSSDKSESISLFLKNYTLSEDLSERFSDKKWKEWPLKPETYSSWIKQSGGDVVNLFMDYESFGLQQRKGGHIFEFMKEFPTEFLRNTQDSFILPSDALKKYKVKHRVDVPFILTWKDAEHDLSSLLGNKMQQEACRGIFELEEAIKSLNDDNLLQDWRKLTSSDHFYFMSTKYWHDSSNPVMHSPFDTPYDAYVYFMNSLNDIVVRVRTKEKELSSDKVSLSKKNKASSV